MESSLQEASSLTEFHWLFSDEQPVESLPPFFPRVISFGQSNSQASSPFQPQPRYRRDQHYEAEPSPVFYQQASPIFNPDDSPVYLPPGTAPSAVYIPSSPIYIPDGDPLPGPSSGCVSKPVPLLSEDVPGVFPRCYDLKRRFEPSDEDDDLHPRKYSRVSESRSTNTSDRTGSDASPGFTPLSTASPQLEDCSRLQNGFDHVRLDHLMEIEGLRAQLAISESRNASALVELAESRTCIDFLLNEVRRVISSSPERQIAEKVQRLIRSSDQHVQLFTRASTQLAGSQQDPLPAFQSKHALLPARLFGRYGPPPSSSQLTLFPASCDPIPSVQFSNYYEPFLAPSEEIYLPRRTQNPNANQLAPDSSHSRLDSFLSFYYTEPPPFADVFQDLAPNYQAPTHPNS